MDMVFFPYNSMFSSQATETKQASVYVLNIDKRPISITHNLYWKKDFLEQAPVKYSQYLSQENISYLEGFFKRKISLPQINNLLTANLTPKEFSQYDWCRWYAKFADTKTNKNSHFELMKYNLSFKNGSMSVQDSTLIFSANK